MSETPGQYNKDDTPTSDDLLLSAFERMPTTKKLELMWDFVYALNTDQITLENTNHDHATGENNYMRKYGARGIRGFEVGSSPFGSNRAISKSNSFLCNRDKGSCLVSAPAVS